MTDQTVTDQAVTEPAVMPLQAVTEPAVMPLRVPAQLRRRRERAVRDQSGYVLGVVLAAMTVGLLLITALLSLSFTTHRAAIAQQRAAAEQRAVDGALETSLTRVRADYNAPGAVDLCGPFAGTPAELDQIAFGSATPQTDDDTTVRVTCDQVLGSGAEANGTVQLVGEDYADASDGADWTGWDWGSALGSTEVPTGDLKPTLVHNADEPLRFNGSVAVRSGAAALLGQPGEAGAVDIKGVYRQGAPGYPGTGSQCGMLLLGSPQVPDGDLSRTAVVDTDATPACGDSKTAGMDTTPVADGPTSLPEPAMPAGCQAGGFTFAPGNYDAAKTEVLNGLFDGSCPGLYHFTPGDYWFDAGGPDSSLIFDDPDSAFVFGTKQGSGATATCDPTAADGAKVVLSGRTTIQHTAGNVSICADGGEGDALVQSEVVESSIRLDNPATFKHCFRWPCLAADKKVDFNPVANVTKPASGDEDAVATVDCFPWDTPCNLRFSVDIASDGSRIMDKLEVAWTSTESPAAHLSNRRVSVTIDPAGSLPTCTASNVPAGRTTGFITAVDLSSDCPDLVGKPESVLNGAKMTLLFRYPNFVGGETLKLNLRGLHMRVNTREINATSADSPVTTASSPSKAWPDTNAVLEAGGAWSTYADPGSCGSVLPPGSCDRSMAGATEPQPLTISGFDPASAGFDADHDKISSLLLAVDNHNGDNQIASPSGGLYRGETRVHLEWNGGADSCDVPWQPINTYTRSERTYYIDVLAAENSSCRVPLATQPMSVLADLSVTFSIRPERGTWILSQPFYNHGLPLPELDHLRLLASSEAVAGLERALVTNDVDHNTRFRVHGDVTMPRTSLDISWAGTVDTDPVVNGSMQVHSLGSTAATGASVGVVCCGSGSREAQIVAEVQDDGGNWVPRGVARAILTRAAAEPLADALVTGWQFCSGNGCPIGSGGGLGPPP